VTAAIFELEKYKDLPLWAQVLLAARMARRSALALPEADSGVRTALLEGCDALEWCTRNARAPLSPAAEPADVRDRLLRAKRAQPTARSRGAACAFEAAADAAAAAEASLDFSAAETACSNSAWNAIAHSSAAHGMTPLQTRILLAADFDLLRFSCAESRVGRYDALPSDVLGRLIPARAPEMAPAREADDPTGGAR
jgi:hypothetical protein